MSGTASQQFLQALESTSWRDRIQLQTIGAIGVAGPVLVGYGIAGAVGAIRQDAYFSRLGLSYLEWGLNPLALALTSVSVLLVTTCVALLYIGVFVLAMIVRQPELISTLSLIRQIRRAKSATTTVLVGMILYGVYYWINPIDISWVDALGLALILVLAAVNCVILYGSVVARRHRTAAAQVGEPHPVTLAPGNFALTLLFINIIGAGVQLIGQQQAGIEEAEMLITSGSTYVTLQTVEALPQYQGQAFGLVTTTSEVWVLVEQQDAPVEDPVIHFVPSVQVQNVVRYP